MRDGESAGRDEVSRARVRRETQIQGLDVPETGAVAYPVFAVRAPLVHGTTSEVAA
jgi:hypothetical protein